MPDHSILAYISEQLSQIPHPVKRWVVAFSGGIDSAVLLHAVATINQRLPQPLPVIALHVHHQLSTQADQWQQHCALFAKALGVDFIAQSVTVNSQGKGLEAAARDARYGVFTQYIQTGDVLLLGHHQQDQSETFLLRLLRGAGVRGLQAMPISRVLGAGHLWRPLLGATKTEITSYAQQHQLLWVDDESNAQEDYDRNFLRHRVVPLLRSRWPAADEQLTKTAARMVEAHALLNEMAETDIANLDQQPARWGCSVNFAEMQKLPQARRNNCIRYWCESIACAIPSADILAEMNTQFFSRTALLSSACVSWGGHEMRQFAGRLYILPILADFDAQTLVVEWDAKDTIQLGTAGSLKCVKEGGLSLPLPQKNYSIRWRQGGERCTPSDRQHSQTLKKLLQEYGLETWLRDRVPLIYCGDELVAVGDLWVNKAYQPKITDSVVSVRWLGA